MSGLAWKLRRLGAMTAPEILHRARIAGRDRLAPPSYERRTPAEAFRQLFAGTAEEVLASSRLAALTHKPSPKSSRKAFAAEIAAADGLMRGEWSVFGRAASLADPPRWNANPLTGAEWPDAPSRALDYRRIDIAGGARYVWEVGRLTTLPTLALAARVTGEAPYAERAIRWLDDFVARNPLGRGIHHTSGIEMAIRVMNVTWTLALLGKHAPNVPLEPCLGLLAQQALHCRDHLSMGSSANNHLIAEYAAMTTLGAIFPAARGAEALLDRGLAGLERETLRQFDPDGVNLEQSFGYLPFVWELLLYPFIAAEAAGRTVPRAVRERLAKTLEFARLVRLPDGRTPQIGDEDDGRLMLLAEDATRLDLVGNALAAWLGRNALSEGGGALAMLLFGTATEARVALDGVRDAGGYTVWRERGLHVTFDHGPLGLPPLAAHGHADALAVTIFRGDDAIVIDPGTFAYHEDPAGRTRCRSTPYHSTVNFGGRSQATPAGAFLWESLPGMRSVTSTRKGARAGECRWTSGETHERSVTVDNGEVRVEDFARGAEPEIVFVLAPGARAELSGAKATVFMGNTRAEFETTELAPWRIELSECAPRFGVVTPTLRLMTALRSDLCVTTVRVGPASA